MSQHIDVFISSTSRDLPEHRKQVMDACLRMGMFPVKMEHLPASDADAIEASLKMVDDAEIYLGVFAWRYGYIPAGHDISITEMEYNRAVERGIPRLIFIMHDDHPIKGSGVEKGAGAPKLELFKERLLTDQVVNFFKSSEELRGLVIHSLVSYRISDPGSLHSRFASEIPLPPEPYIAHPYTLLQTRDLIGRQKELDMLTKWATQSETAVFNFVVAIGGMGKSALTWKWFNDIASDMMPDLAGRMWWSFYESDASFENFIIRALAYVSRRSKEEIEELSPSDREAQLLTILDKEPFLLVWDGFERTMIAYARMDASRMTDDDLDEKTGNYMPGIAGLPESVAHSFTVKHQLRKTADPRIGMFLRKLLNVRKSRILVSTRLYPAELQTDIGQTLPGSDAYYLRGLENEDALALWREFGVTGSLDTLLALFHTFGNYPLLIRALAGEVAQYRRAPGDFDEWRQNNPNFNPFELPAVQVKSHVLAFALEGLSSQLSDLLRTIAAFKMPSTYDTLVALMVTDKGPFTTEYELDAALTELEDRGLVGWNKRANRYDLHPVVRGVAWDSLEMSHRQNLYERLRRHFQSIPVTRDWKEIDSLEDLAPTIELYVSLIGLERFSEACDLFYHRLERATLHRLSSNRQRIELLGMLFPDGLNELPRLSNPSAQAWALNALAMTYDNSGQPGQAIPLYRCQIAIRKKMNELGMASVGLCNLAGVLTNCGELYGAEVAAREILIISRERGDIFREAVGLVRLGSTMAACGKLGHGKVALGRALRIDTAHASSQAQGVDLVYLAQSALWAQNWSEALCLTERAWEMAKSRGYARDYSRVAYMKGTAELNVGEFTAADKNLHYALIQARNIGQVEDELSALTALAKFYHSMANRAAARRSLKDMWSLFERGPYPLFHADALNVLAQIERDEGNTDAAIEAATKAYEFAWCDGPPYAYHWGLEAAKQHLDDLGASYPDMLPFNPDRYEPMPEVDINPPDKFHVEG